MSPLTPASLNIEIAEVVRCSPAAVFALEKLQTKLGAIDECKPLITDIGKIVANNCAQLSDATLDAMSGTIERCASSFASANKMAGPLAMIRIKQESREAIERLSVTEPASTVTTGSTGVPFEAFALNAVTDFVVARAKAEILGWVADEFGTTLCTKHDAHRFDVGSYFPNTCRVFTKADGKVDADLQDFGRSLQAAVQRDLRDSIARLVNGAVEHLDPRLRVLITFASSFIKNRTLATAAAEMDDRMRCKDNRDVCWIKLGLYVLSEVKTTPPADNPADFVASLDKVVSKSPDDDLRKAWSEWKNAVDGVIELAKAAGTVVSALETALSSPGIDAIWDAEAALQDLAKQIAANAPLDQEAKQRIRTTAVRLTVTREWIQLGVSAYQVIDGIRRGEDPLGLIVSAGHALTCRKNRDVTCSIKIGFLVIESITTTPGWNTLRISDLAAIEAFATKAAATFDAQLAALKDGTPAWVRAKITLSSADKIALVKSVFHQVRRIADIVRSAYSPTEKGQPLTRDELLEKAHDLLDATRSLFALASTITDRHAHALTADDIAKAQQLIDDIFAAWEALEQGDAGRFVVSLFAAADELGVVDALPISMRRYVPLVTAVASAKDSAEIKAALEKYAAPVGGYKEKRKRSWMGSVSAFVGIAGGGEKLDVATDSDVHGHAGLFAPIGIDLACGKGHWCNGGGVLLSILDIGNLISLRTDKVDAPDPTFRQVFSPGIYARWNVVGPFSLGGGVAAVPDLRRPEKPEGATTEPDPVGGFKFVVFFAADVTIFPF